jgi:hypothetical protein
MLPYLLGDSRMGLLKALSFRGLLRLSEFFALAKNVAAFETVLLRRFLSPPGLCSSLGLRANNPPGGDDFF